MWLERFMLIATTLHDTFLPNERAMFYPTTWDFVFLFGSVGLFALLIMLCFRLVPVVSIAELRTEAAR
jgi:molybdopterin-containing oxidoreductase family membrane subunit